MNRKIFLLVLSSVLCTMLTAELFIRLDSGVGPAPMLRAAQHSPAGVDAPNGTDADLSITKTDSPDPVTAGSFLTYEVVVTNEGPHGASDVVLVDTLPSSVDYIAASLGCNEENAEETIVNCYVGTLNKGDSAKVTIVVRPRMAGTILNSASVTSKSDPDDSNDTATQWTTVNPPPAVQFSSPTYSVVENEGPIVVMATLSAASDAVTSVRYATNDGTAVADPSGVSGDYLSTTGTLTFTAGTTSLPLVVPIVNDTVFEEDETLTLTLSDPVGLLLGELSVATLTIENDDAMPTVRFGSSAYDVSENSDSVGIIATLSASLNLTATVDYTTVDITAENEEDYVTSSGTLAFSPGDTGQSFDVPIINDDIDEQDETIKLELSNSHNIGLGVPNPAILTIIDDDGVPTVNLTNDAYNIEEDAGSASLIATLSNSTIYTVTTSVRTSDGTAMGNDDYVSVDSELIIPPGQTVITLTVAITDDLDIEGDETFLLTLGTPINATLGSPYSATLTIEDDDQLAGGIFLPAIMQKYCEFTGEYECEPNSSYSEANGPLLSGIGCKGYHDGSGGDWDFYKLYLSEDGHIDIKLKYITDDAVGKDVQLHVYYKSIDVRIGYDSSAPYHMICPSDGLPDVPPCGGGDSGWYYILVYTPSGYSGTPYELEVTITYP